MVMTWCLRPGEPYNFGPLSKVPWAASEGSVCMALSPLGVLGDLSPSLTIFLCKAEGFGGARGRDGEGAGTEGESSPVP